MIKVRSARPADRLAWVRLRHAFWPDGSEAEHLDDIDRDFSGTAHEPVEVLLAESEDGEVVGLVELSIRPSAEGCHTNKVAYLEGWYVVPEARRGGIGRGLVEAAEGWGRAQGCSEFASDAEGDNEISATAHRALRFSEVALVRCFRKRL